MTAERETIDHNHEGGPPVPTPSGPAPGHFRLQIRIPETEVGYIVESTPESFMYEAVDATLLIELDGRATIPPGSDFRVADDGALRNVPIVEFMWKLISACERLGADPNSWERVTVTSTSYVLEFRRTGSQVHVSLVRKTADGLESLGNTTLRIDALIEECITAGRLVFAAVTGENPRLSGNLHLRSFASSISTLADRGSVARNIN